MPKLLDEIINKKALICELCIKHYTQPFFFKPVPFCFGITDSVTEHELNLDVTAFVEGIHSNCTILIKELKLHHTLLVTICCITAAR